VVPLRGLGTTEEMEAAVRQLVAGGVLETARIMESRPAAGLTLTRFSKAPRRTPTARRREPAGAPAR
jgi:hypothetical protein